MSETLIEARDLRRVYGANTAVAGLNLTLKKGEILGLLGPNGAGKTTSMKMLAGCLSPTDGSVQIKGIDLRAQPTAAKKALGYLPEQPPVYPELTVAEYLGFCAGLHGIVRAEREAAVNRAMQACGLSHMAQRLIANLSKGYQQRVGLDPIQIREIRSLISRLGEEHSVILSSHILPEIQATCNRVMIINQGQVVYEASMAEAAKARFDSLVLELARAPEASALQALAGIESVENIGPGRFRLRFDEAADPREAVAAAAAEQGWGLRELHAEQKSLEEVFVELTTGERPQEAA